MRKDTWFMRELYEEDGLSALATYQRNPHIELPASGDVLDNVKPQKGVSLSYAPWDEFSVVAPEAPELLTIYTRVTDANIAVFLEHIRTKRPVDENEFRAFMFNKFACAVYVKTAWRTQGIHLFFITERESGDTTEYGFYFMGRPKTAPATADRIMGQLALHQLIFLSCNDAHYVEVKASTDTNMPMQARKKPWIRPDLPKLIMLERGAAIKYGHRVDRGGTHAAPEPHARRGNWAQLRSPKFKHKLGQRVWRKPSWVGDKEWVWQGQTYRVLDGLRTNKEAT